jgi:hypothetical protein
MPPPVDNDFHAWLEEFTRLAIEQDLEWLVASDPSLRRAAFEAGLSPDEELAALRDISEWRGCGCGG